MVATAPYRFAVATSLAIKSASFMPTRASRAEAGRLTDDTMPSG
jgi:hypothetical protein